MVTDSLSVIARGRSLAVVAVASFAVLISGGCEETPPLPVHPDLVFEGRVTTSSGAPAQAQVRLSQRWSEGADVCSPENWAFLRIADTDDQGRFLLRHELSLGITGCFVLRAYVSTDTLPADSIILTYEDVVALGYPTTSVGITMVVDDPVDPADPS